MKAFTAACAQFAVIPNEPAANVAACVQWITRAAQENGAQLIVLPETITTGFTPRMSAEALWDLAAAKREQLASREVTQRLLREQFWGVLEHLKKPRYENCHNCDVSLHSRGEVRSSTRSPRP